MPPPGYTFLAIGTQDLAQKCIALSSQLGFDVINVTVRIHNETEAQLSLFVLAKSEGSTDFA